jgi:uncharacterized protein YjhX (UPF0386 family)
MLLSQLKIGNKFKLKSIAHNTIGGFIYKIKPNQDIVYEVVKDNKTTKLVKDNSGKLYNLKFKGTNHWRSVAENSLIELIID